MAMSNYNRQNPFMYLLETKQSELVSKTEVSVKNMIIMIITSIIAIILNIIYCILTHDIKMISISLICVYIDITTFLEIRSCIRQIHEKDMNELIFGDAYKDINVNNELLLSRINEYNVSIGKTIHSNEMTYINLILFLVIIAIYIITFMSMIFR